MRFDSVRRYGGILSKNGEVTMRFPVENCSNKAGAEYRDSRTRWIFYDTISQKSEHDSARGMSRATTRLLGPSACDATCSRQVFLR